MKPVKIVKARGGTMDVFSHRAGLLAPPPAPPAPDPEAAAAAAAAAEDTLDAFLAELNGTDDKPAPARVAVSAPELLEQSEAGEGYVAHLDAAYDDDRDDVAGGGELIYDEDGDVIGVARDSRTAETKAVAPLPPVNHAAVVYEPFERCFYAPVAEVAMLSPADIAAARTEAGISVSGADGIAPVASFMHLCLDGAHPALIAALARAGFEAPTGIQSQALPALLSGRDVIGIAETGSGKTLAYALPAIRHVAAQKPLAHGDGPVALVLAPTRELSAQIAAEMRRFAKTLDLQVALLSGGSSLWEQTLALRGGASIVVATPGRLIEHVRSKSTNLRRVTFLVIDEADRLFEMGFQQQVYSILQQVRPDRQTAMFSATFRGRVERLAADATHRPVRIVVGVAGQSAAAVTQHFRILPHAAKWGALVAALPPLLREGKVVVFVSGKAAAEELSTHLNAAAAQLAPHIAVPATAAFAVPLHGDKLQSERDAALAAFKRQPSTAVLVATDLAARGLHVAGVAGVINFDAAKNADTHVHRIGRTGRLGADGVSVAGTAHTFICPHETGFAAGLVRNLQLSGTPVPPEVLALARKHPGFVDGAAPVGGVRRDGMFVGGSGPAGGGIGSGGSSRSYANTGLGFSDDSGGSGSAAYVPPPPMPVWGLVQPRGTGDGVGGPTAPHSSGPGGLFVRAGLSGAAYATGTLSMPLAPVGAVQRDVEYADPESAAAAGAAAWARINAEESAAAASAGQASGPLPAGLAQVIAAAKAAAAEGRAVDSEALSAVAASAAAAASDGGEGGEGDECLEGDEADMTRMRRKRVSRYAVGAPGSERAAAAAELGGQLRFHMAQSFSTSFTAGGVYGGGRDDSAGSMPPPPLPPPAPPTAGVKRSRWSDGPPPPAASAASSVEGVSSDTAVAPVAAGAAARADEAGAADAVAAGSEARPAPRASRFGPPVPVPAPLASLTTAVGGPSPLAVPLLASAWQQPPPTAGRSLYIPGVRY